MANMEKHNEKLAEQSEELVEQSEKLVEHSEKLIELNDPIMQNPKSSEKEEESPLMNNNDSSSTSREEGEISSYSDDANDQNVCSSSQFMSADAASLEQQDHRNTVNENSQDTLAEKCTPSLLDEPSITPQESDHLKSSKRNREHFVPFLISFSDGSGSDSEDSGQKISASKNRTMASDKSNKLPPILQRPQNLQKITRDEENMMPREWPVSHSVVSSLTKINRGTYGNVGRLHSMRNFNNLDKVVTLDHWKRTNVHFYSSEQLDLRHKLNLKRSLNGRYSSSASCWDSNLVNSRNLLVRASRDTTKDNLQELKEPVKKRPKMVSSNPSWGFKEIVSRVIRSEKRALKDSDKLELDDHNSHGERYPSCSVEAGRLKQNEYQGPASSTNPSLTLNEDGLRNHNQSCGNSSKEVASKAANKLDKTKFNSELSSWCRQPLLQKKVSSGPAGVNITEKSNSNLVGSNENTQKPTPDGNNNVASTHGVGRNDGANVISLKLPSFWNCRDKLNISGSSSIDLQSLLHLEELQDKELGEALEYRCKCEVEERNALKSYRKAQRTLFEANARCSDLYNKREQYSAQFWYIMMGNPYLSSSSGSPVEGGIGLDPLPSISDVNVHLVPTSNCAVHPTSDFNNQHRCNLNIHPNTVAHQNISSVQKHCSLTADPSTEPDGVTLVPNKEGNDANGKCAPYEDINMSQNEDQETFQLEHKSPENSPDYQGKVESIVDMETNTNNTSEEDSLLLEATLRSQLFERLRKRTQPEKASPQESLGAVAEGRSENDEFVGRVGMCMDNGLYANSEQENEPQLGSDLQGGVPLCTTDICIYN